MTIADARATCSSAPRPDVVVRPSPAVSTARMAKQLGRCPVNADLLVPPYQADVTDLLTSGSNSFEIRLVPPLRNRLAGLAQAGDPDYPEFISDPERLAPTGLVGTVELVEFAPDTPLP